MIATAAHLATETAALAPALDIPTLLDLAADARPEASALEVPAGETITYRQLARRVRGLAAHLRSHGVRRQEGDPDRVAIVLPNGPDLSLALMAAATAGVAVPFNPAYRADEYEAYFRTTRVGFLLVDRDDHAATATARRLGLEVVMHRPDVAVESGDLPANRPAFAGPRPDDVALILLTSGSTGRGKVVPLTHRNLCRSAADVCRSVELDATDRVLCMWEQFHIGGVVDLLLAPLAAGGTVIAAGGFDAARFFDLLHSTRPTWFQGVPTTLRELCHLADARRIDCRGTALRFIRSVAAALPEEWRGRIEDRFGVPVVRTFGMTEASPLITSTRLPPRTTKPGSVGFPCGPEVRILDDRGGPLDSGLTGQVAIRGATIFPGYEGDDAANAAAFRDGWFLTGDLGHLDADGELFLTGRVKELINRGGEKVAPHEIDEVLVRHPAVSQAAAFGVPHPTLGEDVAAAVVLEKGAVVDEAGLREFAARSLADFKLPRRILFLGDLPRCPVGKVRRRELAEIALRTRPPAARAAATNPLEAAIAALWAEELDVDAVGIDDDFMAVGGDSLASVRIILATEALAGVKIADHVAGRCTTVRKLAAALVELGCPTQGPWPGSAPTASHPVAADTSRRDTLLTAVARALVGRDRLPPDALHRPASVFEFETMRHTAENVSTPAELALLLATRGGVGGLLRAVTRPVATLAIAGRRAEMRRDFHRTVVGAVRPMEWIRSALAEQADLFRSPRAAPTDKTLVVGFSSRSMRLATPTFHVLCGLDPDRHELLMLRDPGRCHYRDGVPGIGDCVTSVAEWLAAFAAREGYRRVVAIGTSSGGMPAVCAAILNRWPRVIACGADRPSGHPHLQPVLSECGPLAARRGTDVILAYSGRNDRDAAGAAEISRLVPTARLAPDDRFADHALLHQLHLAGDLRTFLSAAVDSDAALPHAPARPTPGKERP